MSKDMNDNMDGAMNQDRGFAPLAFVAILAGLFALPPENTEISGVIRWSHTA